MRKVKNVKCYEEEDSIMEDLRVDSLFKKKPGMLESFRPTYGSNSKGNKKEINKHCNEIDMEEDIRDSDYEMFLSSLQPDYDIFLEHFKKNGIGESSLVEFPSSSGDWVIEEEEGSFKNVERKRNLKSDSKRVKAKVPGISGGFLRKAKPNTPKTVKNSSKIRVEGSKNKVRNVPSEERKSLVDENKVSGEPSKKMNSDMVNNSFQVFLDKRGKDIECFSNESDDTSIHRNDDESGSDLEILALDDIPFHEGHCTPFVPSKCYQSLADEDSWDGIRSSRQSQFREKLMDLLKIPYDQNELKNLWQEVTYRKPVQGVKELRHGIMKQYSTNTDGKSYLDWYKELRGKVDEFKRDRRKIFYLLRGFFFWLENTAHEGAFKPWLDSLYLNALG